MGNKSGNAITIDKLSMGTAVTAIQISSRKIDSERVELAQELKELTTDPELLVGNRAELYQEVLDTIRGLVDDVAEACLSLRKVAQERNSTFNLGIDFKKVDAKAMESDEKSRSLRARKLKGV